MTFLLVTLQKTLMILAVVSIFLLVCITLFPCITLTPGSLIVMLAHVRCSMYLMLAYSIMWRIFFVRIGRSVFVSRASVMCLRIFSLYVLQSSSDFKHSGIHFSPSECQFVMAGNLYFRGMAGQASNPAFWAPNLGTWKVAFSFLL